MTRPLVLVVQDPALADAARREAEARGVAVRACASAAEVASALDALEGGAALDEAREAGFVASMSHELRTPLNAVIGFSELLVEEVPGPLSAKQKDYVESVLTSGRALLDLINDLVDVAKFDAGRLTLAREPMPLVLVADAMQHLLHPIGDKRGVALTLDIPADLPLVAGDASRLKQALFHLVASALEATPRGGAVSLVAMPVGEWLVTTIVDGAPTLDAAARAAFFDERAVPTGEARAAAGARLGLPLARRIVVAHGGTLEIAPGSPEGNVVTAKLPLLA